MFNEFKNVIFMDLEANISSKSKEINILQLSAIKMNNINKIEKFDQYCYFNKNIEKRISNLLSKSIDFFKNEKFKSEKDVYLDFLNFTKNCKVFVFGKFDQEVLNKVSNRYKIPRINVIDLQNDINKFLKISKFCLGLKKIAMILNIDFKNEHNSLEDARVLFEICFSLFKNEFNIDNLKKRIFHIQNIPSLINNEFINFKKIKKTKLNNNFNIISFNVSIKEKKFKPLIDKEELKDVFISHELINELNTSQKFYFILNINITKYGEDLKLIFNKKLKLKYETKKNINQTKNNKIIEILNKNLDFLNDFIFKNIDSLFISNSKKIMIYLAKKFDVQFTFIINNKNLSIQEIKKIKENTINALMIFKNEI